MKRIEDFEEHPWMIVPVQPGAERNLRRWNLALIAALVFIVMGVFFMTMTPELGASASGTRHRPAKVHAVHHYPS